MIWVMGLYTEGNLYQSIIKQIPRRGVDCITVPGYMIVIWY
jgi:hypothetical protein